LPSRHHTGPKKNENPVIVYIRLKQQNTKGSPSNGPFSMTYQLPYQIIVVTCVLGFLNHGAITWGSNLSPIEMDSDVVIVMQDKAFHVIKGGDPNPDNPSFFMEAGVEHMITLRNEDTVAHEFVTPYFRNVEVTLSGEATMVFPKFAAGFRVDPGKTVTIRFTAPHLVGGMKRREDLFWCNIHGKKPGSKMRGELLLTETVRDLPGEEAGDRP